MLNILVTGCKGRMGKSVLEALDNDNQAVAKVAIDSEDSIYEGLKVCDFVIDFTLPSFTNELIEACLKLNKGIVMGTTGHSLKQLNLINEASKNIPIVHAPNFSVGVNTLFWLTKVACNVLGDDFDLEVIEMHHRHKKDSPSGTAKKIAEILAKERRVFYDKDCKHGRYGDVGARSKNEIGVHAIRGGDVIGDHTVVYADDGERLELTHKASSRLAFSKGSVRAVKWLHEKNIKLGLFDMQDVLSDLFNSYNEGAS